MVTAVPGPSVSLVLPVSRLALIGSRSFPRRAESEGEARLRRLMELHFDFVWRSLRRLGLSNADADDGAQEVFLIVSRKLSLIAVDSEKRFLFATALRIASTKRRSLRRRKEEPRPFLGEDEQEPERERSQPGPERLVELAKAREDLEQIMNGMELEQRAVFILYELEELTVPEIASTLQLPVGTVSSRLRAAREKFESGLKRVRAREAFGVGKS